MDFTNFFISEKRLPDTIRHQRGDIGETVLICKTDKCPDDYKNETGNSFGFEIKLYKGSGSDFIDVSHTVYNESGRDVISQGIARIDCKSKDITNLDDIIEDLRKNKTSFAQEAVQNLTLIQAAFIEILIIMKQAHAEMEAQQQKAIHDLHRLMLAFRICIDKTLSLENLREIENLLINNSCLSKD